MVTKSVHTTEIPTSCRVWIYPIDKELDLEQIGLVNAAINSFVSQWTAHSTPLKAYAEIWNNRFIVLAVDESHYSASGCSIDSSVRFITELGQKFNFDPFNRMKFYVLSDDQRAQGFDLDAFKLGYSNQVLKDETNVFDPLVNSIQQAKEGFVKPLSVSWHSRFV